MVLCGEIGLHCANELLHNLFSRKVIVRDALGVAFSRKVIVRVLSGFFSLFFSIEYSIKKYCYSTFTTTTAIVLLL